MIQGGAKRVKLRVTEHETGNQPNRAQEACV